MNNKIKVFGKGKVLYLFNNDTSEIEVKVSDNSFSEILCTYRFNSCFMKSVSIDNFIKVPVETQYILQKNKEIYTLWYALVGSNSRTSFFGSEQGLMAKTETGDSSEIIENCNSVYIVEGKILTQLFDYASKDLAELMPGLKLLSKKDKSQLYGKLGFCTYNAFYNDYSESKIFELLEIIKQHGQKFGFLLLDDGWEQSSKEKLTSFHPDINKFKKGFKSFTSKLKKKYNIKEVIAWHCLYGYWLGLDDKLKQKYRAEEKIYGNKNQRINSEKQINTICDGFYADNIQGRKANIIFDNVKEFYNDFYKYLKRNGITGTKIDACSWLELFGEGKGGRTKLFKKYCNAVNYSGKKYFNNNIISCSSQANDYMYNMNDMSLLRIGSDYIPNKPETHGEKIINDSYNTIWLSKFMLCDCDMFQTGIDSGLFHAINSAVSGGLVYITDNIKTIDFKIISALSDKDGFVPVFNQCAEITEDSFFINVNKKLFKRYNYDSFGRICVALFNCGVQEIADSFCLDNVHADKNKKYVIYSYKKGFLGVYKSNQKVNCCLKPIEADLFTAVPIINQIAIIGNLNKIIPFGYIKKIRKKSNKLFIKMRTSGSLGIYTENKYIDSITKEIIIGFKHYYNVKIINLKKNREV